jgi:hypothetical protein
MRIASLLAILVVPLLLAGAPDASAQDTAWRPPTTQMPAMPRPADLQGDFISANSSWFAGVEAVSGVATSRLRAGGDRQRGGDRMQIVRFSAGPVPAVVWSDRNGDGIADMIEILRSGGVIIQLIDADYSGRANVMRVYDESGALVREVRL